MPRKYEPSFDLKLITWDIAATTGTDNLSTIYRELDRKLEELRKEGKLFEDTPDQRKVKNIIELDIQRLKPEVVIAKLPRHIWHLRNDYEAIEQLSIIIKTKQQTSQEAVVDQEPYKETPHKKKIRELAKALAQGITLPSNWDKDLWTDLDVGFQPGKYHLSIGTVEVTEDSQIVVNFPNVGAEIAEPHLVEALFGHLGTSRLPKFTKLVGDKGKLGNLSSKAGLYSQALLTFLKLIADKVKGYRAIVNFRYKLKPGLTTWFILTVWNDAIQKASGHSWIDDSWYKPHESISGTNLWQLRCGPYAIGIAKTNRTLKIYENWHKKLRLKYAEHPLAEDIHVRSQELSQIAQDNRQRLQEFSDMEHLPGHCELC